MLYLGNLRPKSFFIFFNVLTINLPFMLLTMKKALIRKSWPKIRVVETKGQVFYRVDARRTGTNGKQESFKSKKEAEGRAAEVATQFGANGKEGLSFPAELRGMALTGDKMPRPHGKTILQAVQFYVAHLEADQQRKDSALVPILAQQWV